MEGKVSRTTRNISAVAAASVFLASCSAPLTREGRIGADDGGDVCRANVVALDSAGNFFAEDMIKGAAIGAVSGALIGVLASGGKDVGKNAAMGALAGGVAGAAAGYWQHKVQQDKDQAILAVRKDLETEVAQMDKANQSFKALTECRQQQFAKIKADYKAKIITRQQADAQWAAQRNYLDRDIKLAQMIDENMTKRGESYDYANQQINGPDSTTVVATNTAPAQATSKPAVQKTSNAQTSKTQKQSSRPTQTAAKPAPANPEIAQLTSTRSIKKQEFGGTYQIASNLQSETAAQGWDNNSWYDRGLQLLGIG